MSKHNQTSDLKLVDEQSANLIKGPVILQDDQLSENISDDIDQPSSEIIAETELNERFIYENGIFESRSNGLYYVHSHDENSSKPPEEYGIFICSPIEVIARTRDVHSTAWGILIRWFDADGVMHQHSIAMDSFHGDTREYRKYLASQGLIITPNTKHRQYLDIYLQQHPIETRSLCVDKLGWHGDRYVLHNHSLGENTSEMTVYQSDSTNSSALSQRGTVVQWRDEICKLIAEQSRLVFSVCCAFSGQLLEPLGYDGGGFHILGSSSIGKSITMCLAASIWGNPKQTVRTWRQTDNALEGTASEHNDSVLFLDEISEIDPTIIGKTAYMLSNGTGKFRSSTSGTNQKPYTWRTIFLSNGEQSIQQHMNNVSQRTNAGIETRVAHIEADAGFGHGVFDSIVMAESGSAQADMIKELASQYYGTAGIAWLNYITADKAKTTAEAKQKIESFMSQYDGLSLQAHRVAKRFALVAAAGEMATQAGITAWQEGQATSAVKICLDNWLGNYGHDGEHEKRQIINNVKAFIEKHGSSRFQPCYDKASTVFEDKISNCAGYHNRDTNDFYFFTSDFEKDVCSPFSKRKVLKVIEEAGLLIMNEFGRNTYKTPTTCIKQRPRVYGIKGSILNYEPA
ncbi:DUF927 domain-containing protein [Psychrobacter sp. ASPA161_6]|uniref:DUF927 domain-containing protein n=1 Tax=Psychrobacter sp. ASPA161_6 TaxID=3160962 RepID=UPI003F7D73D1